MHTGLEAFLASRTDVRWVGGSAHDLERVLDEVDAVVAAAAGPVSG